MQSNPRPTLRHQLRRALVTVMATGPALGGCGGIKEVPPGIETDPAFVPVECDGDAPDLLSDLTPVPPPDYMELDLFSRSLTEGTSCATASSKVQCEDALTSLRDTVEQSLPFGSGGFEFGDLLVTRGDDVFAISTLEALVEFLRPIDTPGEALLLAHVSRFDLPCVRSGSRPNGDGFDVQAFHIGGCGGRDRFLLTVEPNGTVTQVEMVQERASDPNCTVGRRPAGLRPTPCSAPSEAPGGYLSRAATLEAASVHAFVRLAVELRAHDAPARLVRSAVRAARDEVRHARVVGRLAQRFGAPAVAPRVDGLPIRDLETIALENATEGCVRETYGVLMGQWQALHARDRTVARAYTRIVEDELRHAELAWSTARWLSTRLTAPQRRRVDAARREALTRLDQDLAIDPSREVMRVLGVPSAATARALARRFQVEGGFCRT